MAKSKLVFRQGFLDEVKALKGVQSDEAMARISGVSRQTYLKARDREQAASTEMLVNLFDAWGYDIGVMAEIVPTEKHEKAV